MLIHRIAAKVQEMIGSIDNGGVDKRLWRGARRLPAFALLLNGLLDRTQQTELDK